MQETWGLSSVDAIYLELDTAIMYALIIYTVANGKKGPISLLLQ